MYICVCIYICKCVYIHLYTHVYIHMYIYIYVCSYIRVYIHIQRLLFLCLYTSIHKEGLKYWPLLLALTLFLLVVVGIEVWAFFYLACKGYIWIRDEWSVPRAHVLDCRY